MNTTLEGRRHVHFVGIAGIGMSALARLLLARGITVSGSDRNPGEQGQALESLGARIFTGHDAHQIEGADLVVVTSAARNNPEVNAAHQQHIEVARRAEVLAAVMNAGRGVAIAGTHGKTTTSALIAHILVEAGLDPTVLIGGISANLGSNARAGSSDLIVVEADEYDASFLPLRPDIAVVTNVEPDHLDFYPDRESYEASFRQFVSQVSGTLLVCADDRTALGISQWSPARVVTYGLTTGGLRARHVQESAEWTGFSCEVNGELVQFRVSMPGLHNVANCLAAIGVAHALEIPVHTVKLALAAFTGVARRQEVKGTVGGIVVVDDYAHHPTEISVTLAALKNRYGRPLRVVFQPHTYTRTHALLTDFSAAFADASHLYVLDVYAARETETLGMSGQIVADAVATSHPAVKFVGTHECALQTVLAEVEPGDVIVTMGAGDVTELGPQLMRGMRS